MLATEVSSAGSSTHEHSAACHELSEYEVNRAPASFNLHYFQISMDPLACFFVLILGGEVYETAKLLRGHWFGLRGPIRLFGFLSLSDERAVARRQHGLALGGPPARRAPP